MHWLVTALIVLACTFVIVFVVAFLIALQKVKKGKLQKEAKKINNVKGNNNVK